MSKPIPTRFRVNSYAGRDCKGRVLSTEEIELTEEEASIEVHFRREASTLKVAKLIDKTGRGLAPGAVSFGLIVLS